MYCWECECGSGALFGKYIMIATAVLQGNAVENIMSLVQNEVQISVLLPCDMFVSCCVISLEIL